MILTFNLFIIFIQKFLGETFYQTYQMNIFLNVILKNLKVKLNFFTFYKVKQYNFIYKFIRPILPCFQSILIGLF